MTKTENIQTKFWLDFLLSTITALLFCFLFLYINAFISVQLRQISSVIARFFLKMMNFSVTRSGTLLTISGMQFDVAPACSGSGFITMLTAVGIILCGIRSGMTLTKKIFCIAMTVPVAVFANALRVALLTGGSYLVQEQITAGVLHTLIGLLSFVFAILMFFLLSEAVTEIKFAAKKTADLNKIFLFTLGLLLLFVYLPFFISCMFEWKGGAFSREDSYAFIYVIAGGSAFLISWYRQPNDYSSGTAGTIIFCLCTAFLILVQQNTSNNYAQGISMLVTLFSLALIFKGRKFALAITPLLIVVLLGYPKVSETINHMFGFSGYVYSMLLRLFPAIMLIALSRILYILTPEKAPIVTPRPYLFIPVLVLALTAFGFQVVKTTAHPAGKRLPISISFLYGDWEGRDIPLSNTEKQFFGNQTVINRIYHNGSDSVGLLLISSAAGRRKIHTPEYCQTGAGWKILKRSHVSLLLGDNKESVRAVKLLMGNQAYPGLRTFVYWFSDGKKTFPEYPGVIFQDTLNALKGEKTNWFLYALWTDNNEITLNQFFSVFKPLTMLKQ